MPLVGRLGKILGPRNLMPNPKGWHRDDGRENRRRSSQGRRSAVQGRKGGRHVHAGIGKVSFSEDKLAQNVRAFVEAVSQVPGPGAKGAYLKKVSLSSTMGPGVSVDIASTSAQ